MYHFISWKPCKKLLIHWSLKNTPVEITNHCSFLLQRQTDSGSFAFNIFFKRRETAEAVTSVLAFAIESLTGVFFNHYQELENDIPRAIEVLLQWVEAIEAFTGEV